MGKRDRLVRWCSIAAAAGAVFGELCSVPPAAAAVGAALLALLVPYSRAALPALLGLVAGALQGPTEAPTSHGPHGEIRAVIRGTVTHLRCDSLEDRCRVRLEDARADDQPIEGSLYLTLLVGQEHPPAVGARIETAARLFARRSGSNPGVLPAWLQRPTFWSAVALDEPREVAASNGLIAARQRLAARLELPDPRATALYRALLLGQREDLEDGLRGHFVDTGTVHLLAISGLHLAVVGWGLYRLLLLLLLLSPRLRQAGRPCAWAGGGAIGLTWTYVALIAHSDATLRAAIVLTLVLGGVICGRRPRGRRSLLLAATAIAVLDPRSALLPSFQLSFAAAAALVLSRRWFATTTAWLDEPGRLPGPRWRLVARPLVALAASSTLCFLATAPLALAYFGQLAPVGLLVNLVAVPLVALVVVPIGFIWLVLGLLLPELATALSFLPTTAAGLLFDLTEGWASVAGPAQQACWPHLAGLLGSAAVLLALASGRYARAAAGVAMSCLVVVHLQGGDGLRSDELRLTALDVGHGESLLVQLPEGQTLLVDAGGRSLPGERGRLANRSLAHRRVLPALARLGVERVDLMVISHSHPDHLGAAADIAGQLRVGQLWLSPCTGGAPAVRRLVAAVAGAGGHVLIVGRSPPIEVGGARLTVVWPPQDSLRSDGSCRHDLNDSSLVLRVDYAGRSVLLTGDVEARAEQELLSLDRAALRADVLKAPHHASRTSSSEAFLEAVRPSLAIVSGGYRARGRMPPHRSVLARYRRHRVKLRWTGRDGAVTVRVGGGGEVRESVRLGLRPP